MNSRIIKQTLAKGIARLAEKQAQNYVGKSFPLGLHEAVVPEAVKKELGIPSEQK
ncbi:MAG: hypothetical protein FWC09_06015 [Lachnospiraceae bacterium]|nr:hypothetical protein [Lachnospiraceae bacterium]